MHTQSYTTKSLHAITAALTAMLETTDSIDRDNARAIASNVVMAVAYLPCETEQREINALIQRQAAAHGILPVFARVAAHITTDFAYAFRGVGL
jgi:hypothetical protein